MKAPGSVLFLLLVLIGACATSVAPEVSGPDPEDDQTDGGSSTGSGGGSAFGGTKASGGATSKAGSSSTAGKASGGAASGGTGSEPVGGAVASGGQASAGSGGRSSAGAGGKATGGSGGAPSGGALGTGDCDGVAAFAVGASTKYALDAKVVATCTVGTPCTLEQPPLQTGKVYEFSCKDQFNCGGQDPGTTNWAQPPWKVTRACNP